jgi:hypothetical protein
MHRMKERSKKARAVGIARQAPMFAVVFALMLCLPIIDWVYPWDAQAIHDFVKFEGWYIVRSGVAAFIAAAVVNAAIDSLWGEDPRLRTHRTLAVSVLAATLLMFIDPLHQFGLVGFVPNALEPLQLAKPYFAGAVAGLAVSLAVRLRILDWLLGDDRLARNNDRIQ